MRGLEVDDDSVCYVVVKGYVKGCPVVFVEVWDLWGMGCGIGGTLL